jgi:hypothetical protein
VLPVSLSNPSCLSDCRTFDAMFAVPSVSPIQEDEMRLRQAIGRFVDAEEPLHRRSLSALLLRVQLLHAKLSRGRLRLDSPRFAAAASTTLLVAPSASTWVLVQPPLCRFFNTPRFVDSRHRNSYPLLQM